MNTKKIALAGMTALLAACSSSPIEASPTPFVASSATAQPTATEIATPTEVPDPLAEAAESIPAEWGKITVNEDGTATYDSPENVIVGKDVEVELSQLSIDGVDRNTIVVDGQWPLFIQNETGGWEETGIEYVDVTKSLVDAEGNPVHLTFDYLGNKEVVSGFFVINGEPFVEDNVKFQPVGISLDGKVHGGLMLTNVNLPIEIDWINVPKKGYTRTNFVELKNSIFGGFNSALGEAVKDHFAWNSLEQGEVFYAQILVDNPGFKEELDKILAMGNNFAINRLKKVLENKDVTLRIFDSVMDKHFTPEMLDRLDAWITWFLAIAKK